MERTMQSIKQDPIAEDAEQTEDSAASPVSANESDETDPVQVTGNSLAPPKPMRWVAHRKAEVVAAVRGGIISLNEACQRYALSVEEYLSWEREIDISGLPGLRMNRTQQRRRNGLSSADG